MQRNKEPPRKSMRNAKSKGKAKRSRIRLMARRIRPKDIATLIATLVTTVAGLYTSVMELKREWSIRQRNKTKPSKRKKRLKTPKRSHNKKPEKKHETKTETKPEK